MPSPDVLVDILYISSLYSVPKLFRFQFLDMKQQSKLKSRFLKMCVYTVVVVVWSYVAYQEQRAILIGTRPLVANLHFIDDYY